MSATAALRMLAGAAAGGLLGLAYQKLIGCSSGTCPLTSTPSRAMVVGAVLGLLITLPGASAHPDPASEPTMSNASKVIHLTRGAFPKLQAQDKVVLIDFWAPWCGPCRMQGPILDQVSIQMGDRAIVAKVNVDEEPALATPFGIQAIPTLVILKNGKTVQRFTGVQQAETLMEALEAAGA